MFQYNNNNNNNNNTNNKKMNTTVLESKVRYVQNQLN